jgi:dihydrolipoamide dehydrogenase
MTTRKVDIAIIGAGSAGMRAYREAVQTTDEVLLIEGNQYGTTCARVGCMPSKLLIAAAEAAHHGREAAGFGVHFGAPRIDGEAVMRRVREERDRFVGHVVAAVEAWPARHRILARARFRADHLLDLSDGSTVQADRIVIATGSRTDVLPVFQPFGERLVVNDDVFDWHDLPDSVAVFGAGVIGLELGQALHRLGVRVGLFGRDGLVGPLTDPEVRGHAADIFAREIDFLPHAEVTGHAGGEGCVEFEVARPGGLRKESYDYALVATGRRPNVDDLGLENTTLERDDRGVPVYDAYTGQCGDSRVFIAGDANDRLPLLHEAADEGMAAGYNAAHHPETRRFARSAAISIVFTDPQIAMVGESFAELTERRADFAVGGFDWADQGRARVMRQNAGLIRLYGERNTGRFLGAEMIGPRAEHMAHLLAWSLQSGLTVSQMLERPFYHPVLEEGLRTALRSLNRALEMGPSYPARCLDCGPGA